MHFYHEPLAREIGRTLPMPPALNKYCIVLYICVIDQAWGQDGWILAKFSILIEQAWSIKDLLYGFTIKLKLPQQNKTRRETALPGKKFFIAGRCKIYFQCIFGLACNRGKQGILNYLRVLTLKWFKGSIQLLRTKNLDSRKSGKIWIESGKLAIFSRSRGGVNNKNFYTVFGLQSLILEWNNRFWDYMQTQPEKKSR